MTQTPDLTSPTAKPSAIERIAATVADRAPQPAEQAVGPTSKDIANALLVAVHDVKGGSLNIRVFVDQVGQLAKQLSKIA